MKGFTEHPRIGKVIISRTRRATRISLSVRPDGSVRLSYPMFVSTKKALKFLDEKCDWILDNRLKMANRYSREPIDEAYRTRRHSLVFECSEEEKISVRIKDGTIRVKYPSPMDRYSEEVQSMAEKGVVEALRIEAKEMLPQLVGSLARAHGFTHGDVRVKASRSKWGSCTSRNDINLSLFLGLLPDHLIDYIILHELCHTVHKDHSERFHALLDTVTEGKHRTLNRELRSYRPDIRSGKKAGD